MTERRANDAFDTGARCESCVGGRHEKGAGGAGDAVGDEVGTYPCVVSMFEMLNFFFFIRV